MKPSIETPYRIEPTFLEKVSPELTDLIANLSAASERLGSHLQRDTAASLAHLVRIMNCYYSNLIEGHNTTPREIELALENRLAETEERRNLQLEAQAHIRVQREIEEQWREGVLPDPASISFIRWIHQSFYKDAPEAMLLVKGKNRSVRMLPGEFRSGTHQEVSIGQHIPPSSTVVETFMRYFEQRYSFSSLGKGSRILAMAAAHHRFNYIHPFLDGNGRVSRLMSHAMALHAVVGAQGLWSVSRGLARGLENRGEYKQMMQYADTPRQGDLDGRGNLSHKALYDFVIWFLRVCLDQVTFMEKLFEFNTLVRRLQIYVSERAFKPEAFFVLQAAFLKGSLERGEIASITRMKERTARMLLSTLIQDGILGSSTPKGPVSLRFLPNAAGLLFPNLF